MESEDKNCALLQFEHAARSPVGHSATEDHTNVHCTQRS